MKKLLLARHTWEVGIDKWLTSEFALGYFTFLVRKALAHTRTHTTQASRIESLAAKSQAAGRSGMMSKNCQGGKSLEAVFNGN